MINLGHSCDTLVVGEGVESIEQYRHLKEANCDLIQGYLFSQPLTYLQFIEFVRDHNPQAILDPQSTVDSSPDERIVSLTQKNNLNTSLHIFEFVLVATIIRSAESSPSHPSHPFHPSHPR